MAGRSEKKLAKEKTSTMNLAFYSLIIVGVVNFILLMYFSSFDLVSNLFKIILLNGINIGLYNLLDFFYESMFFNPLVDFLIINYVVMIGINFHFKFWYFYLVIPGYFIYKGALWAFDHVKNLDKSDGNVETQGAEGQTSQKEKQKKKIIKY